LRSALDRERIALAALQSAVEIRRTASSKREQVSATLQQARAPLAGEYNDAAATAARIAAQAERETIVLAPYYQKLAGNPNGPAQTSALPPLPLARYLGAWVYPTGGGLFHGIEPELVDLTVREDHGHVEGNLYVRYRVPLNSSADPVVRFDFQGEMQATPE